MVLLQKVKISLEELHVLCLRWRKRKFLHGMFKWLGGKYGGFYRTHEGATILGGRTTGSRRESRKVGKGKSTKL